jgi:hypothetical protein
MLCSFKCLKLSTTKLLAHFSKTKILPQFNRFASSMDTPVASVLKGIWKSEATTTLTITSVDKDLLEGKVTEDRKDSSLTGKYCVLPDGSIEVGFTSVWTKVAPDRMPQIISWSGIMIPPSKTSIAPVMHLTWTRTKSPKESEFNSSKELTTNDMWDTTSIGKIKFTKEVRVPSFHGTLIEIYKYTTSLTHHRYIPTVEVSQFLKDV